jgi:predicted Zn-dependent protease with MMP-like domain
MRDNNRLNELSVVIDKELGLTPKDFDRTIECSLEGNNAERIPTMTTPKDIEERVKDKACKVFKEMLVELRPELLGYGAMAVEWENEFRKRLEQCECFDFANNNHTEANVQDTGGNHIVTIDEDNIEDFMADDVYETYTNIIGKCFINRECGIAVKILHIPHNDDYFKPYEFIYEKFEELEFCNGWEVEDYNWLQEQSAETYNRYKLTPYANINIASENMFQLGKNGKLYTSVDCGEDWYEYVEMSPEEFEKIKKEAIENKNNYDF